MVYRLSSIALQIESFSNGPNPSSGQLSPSGKLQTPRGHRTVSGVLLVNQQDLTAANVEKSSPKLCTVTENHSISFVSSKAEATVFDNDSTEREPLVL